MGKPIQIVTAFYDIGRGNIPEISESGKPYPFYLKRTTEEYLSYFKLLCMLENDIIVFTSADMVDKIKQVSGNAGNVRIFEYEIFDRNKDFLDRMRSVQQSKEFKDQFDDDQLLNIEYWSPEYIFVNMMKSNYINRAYNLGLIDDSSAAWVDFGMFRDISQLPESKAWSVDIEKNKISVFSCKDFTINSLDDAVELSKHNLMYLAGTVLLGDRASWRLLEDYIFEANEVLMSHSLVDDDQGLMLVALSLHSELFRVYGLGLPYFDSLCSLRDIMKYFINDVETFEYPLDKVAEWRFPGIPGRGN